jgi:hypothetical protein
MMEKSELQIGQIVQLGPNAGNPAFTYCLMVVTEIRVWGAQGFVQALGTRDEIGGQAYYRAKWDEMEPTGGFAVWMPVEQTDTNALIKSTGHHVDPGA